MRFKDFLLKLYILLKKYYELIIIFVVIIISLVILYSYFLSGDKNSRDAERYADLLKISDNLKVYYSKANVYPLPDEYVNVTASGEILTYQGYLGEENFKNLGMQEIKDPLEDKLFKYLNYYTYSTDKDKQNFQLMAFYENNDITTYNPVSKRIPFNYGDEVGIVLEEKTERPLQETKLGIDVLNTQSLYTIYVDNNNILTGNNLKLKNLLGKSTLSISKSCLELKNAGWNENGNYYINPLYGTVYKDYAKSMKVYCDMENDGGGWTRLYYKNGKNTCFNDGTGYNSFMIERLFSKDFAVSDNAETLKSEGSWILKDVDFKYKDFDFAKMANVANCRTPSGTNWSMDYGSNYIYYHEGPNGELIRELDDNSGLLKINGKLNTLGSWKNMFYGCESYVKLGNNIDFMLGGFEKHTGIFINGTCNNFSDKDNSITSRWDWDNTRVIWVR